MNAFPQTRSGRIPPSEALTPNSHQKQRSSSRIPKENVDPNPLPLDKPSLRSPSVPGRPLGAKNRSPLPPRPPHDTPLKKKKLNLECLPENSVPASVTFDSGVQVIVRMRPLNTEEEEGDQLVQKISPDSISILDHTFTFDSVADARSTQQDIFQLVGLPLVENCLAGFNSSIFAYGQTGSGKTYTMWGPPSTLSEEGSLSSERGLMPRVFERLFSRINEEQVKHSNKQLNYQCRCSFLEIYNEQITDLLDPSQKNLQIREDVRTGVYVDYLLEEYVCTMKDVTQLLIKGMANRRTAATSINAESSRSHCVFTCVVESRSKSMADGLSSLRTSRINLVDLAGSERQKLTSAAGERLKEAGNINRSLSQLGNLINILAEVSQSGKQRHIPYRDSRLTFLLQESLGGNAKLAMICAISPSLGCKSETFSTLRFAQRTKAITNKAVVNEITQDDVNVLREQIRQLKDELLRMKSKGASTECNGSYSTGWNARRSLNLLKMSLSHPMVLPVVEDDNDEEMEIDEEDVERSGIQSALQSAASDEIITDVHKTSVQQQGLKESSLGDHDDKTVYIDMPTKHSTGSSCDSEQTREVDVSIEGSEPKDVAMSGLNPNSDVANYGFTNDNDEKKMVQKNAKSLSADSTGEPIGEKVVVLQDSMSTECNLLEEKTFSCLDSRVGKDSTDSSVLGPSHNSSSNSPNSVPSNLSIVPCQASPHLQSPTLSISPTADNYIKKSLKTSSLMSTSRKDLVESKSGSEAVNLSFAHSLKSGSSNIPLNQKSKSSLTPTEHLATSLHRGLQIIDSHQQISPLRRSSFRFSFKHMDTKPFLPVAKVDVGIQTLFQESEIPEESRSFMCNYCKNRAPPLECKDASNDRELQIVSVDGSQSADKSKKQVPKAVEKVLAGAIRREMALEDHCAKQTAEIVQLNRLVQQYKHERECNAIIEQTREDKICRLEGLMDGILPTEEFMEEEFMSLANEHKLLKEKYDYHPEVLRVNIELKRVQDELEGYRNFFDLGEREVLMEEIQDLKNQLQYYIDSSPMLPCKISSLLQSTHCNEPISAPFVRIPESTKESSDENFEQARRLWTETESKWISLSEELRLELEASRFLSEKWKLELDSEKKCSEELKEALQTAMQGHARILDQYADLQEKHIALLARHQQFRDGIEDVKRAAAKAGVKGAESKFINSLACQLSAIKVEREKERRYWKDENKGLQVQLRDTAEAVQAAGELIVRLKEAEEAAASAQKRTIATEKEAEKAHQEIDSLKKKHQRDIDTLNQFLTESRLPKEALRPAYCDADMAKYDGGESLTDQRWKEEFEPFCQDGEFSKGAEPSSWFSGYDRCNI